MIPYRDKSGRSGVSYYEIGPDWIKLMFKTDRHIYLYTYDMPGEEEVETMKDLATKGKGLTTYVNKYVRENYHAKS